MGQHYPVLFVGSATEDLAIAQAVQQQLEHDAEVEIWNEGTFVVSGYALDSLMVAAHRVDFALFVATGLDTLVTRQETLTTTRDNVIFELGLFMGLLGRDRTFLLTNRSEHLHLPTDLNGFTTITFDSRKTNLASAVGSACTEIRQAIHHQGVRGGSSDA